MLPYQERVVEEKQELDLKIARLNSFLSDHPKSLSDVEYVLLAEQLKAMQLYSSILMQRIRHFYKNTV